MGWNSREVGDQFPERMRTSADTDNINGVRHAIEELLVTYARWRTIEQLQHMNGLDLDQPEVMVRAWR